MTRLLEQFETMDFEDFEELLADKPADERWELLDRRVVKMMVGARWEHGNIVQNLNRALMNHLHGPGKPYRVYSESFLMKSKLVESAAVPDILVRCGALVPGAASCDDPTVLVEVISPGSAHRDRSVKWSIYRRLPSLQHYVLIERDRAAIDIFDRSGDAWSALRTVEGLDATLDLPAIGFSMSLAEVYQGVPIT